MRKEELKRRQIMARGKLDALIQETERVREVAENAPEILADLDEQFSRKTGLNKTDFVFLFLETALQVMRWVLAPRIGEAFNPDDRLKENDKSIKDEIPCRRIYRCSSFFVQSRLQMASSVPISPFRLDSTLERKCL